jgi:hypothetical protein
MQAMAVISVQYNLNVVLWMKLSNVSLVKYRGTKTNSGEINWKNLINNFSSALFGLIVFIICENICVHRQTHV